MTEAVKLEPATTRLDDKLLDTNSKDALLARRDVRW